MSMQQEKQQNFLFMTPGAISLGGRNVSFTSTQVFGTNIYTNSFPALVSTFYNYVMWPFIWPFSVNLSESGERHLLHLSSARYPAKQGIPQGVPVETGDVAIGTNGEIGSGAYLLNWKGEVRPSTKALAQYREQGIPERVWGHTETLLHEAVRQ
ncbi:uncharacterized protein NFIA_077190 [Aspergillus fischeri NRRL 181]|uniref:Uncharacterized protein n=1 Tax=Neosartorya fischeri (strain ATCC 1020 / DSM 3700 / CBS 544.65 / FGSC A1164 / JCM 1740 / NRRL 181 / WB 181) TaxID=331117 RepID=A1DEH9_NEOFI|nr:uncharacterized protein NFIA_077190 [Aspergillus fischeri NRRL 181]EAW17786.1 hypothetical protein NFIA_077190 [Aspergillus fischeri NRRL 181]